MAVAVSTAALRISTPKFRHSQGRCYSFMRSSNNREQHICEALKPILYRISLRGGRKLRIAQIGFNQSKTLISCKTEAASDTAGEDAAKFELDKQRFSSWTYFTLILGTVLTVLYVGWIDPKTGFGDDYVSAVSSLSSSHEVILLLLLFNFAIVHSGMASIRDFGERLIGERAYRVLFAGASLPLAFSAVAYFINHRYDGVQLWQVQNVPGVHQLVWLMSFISFFFLYPSTFNLLEVAAVDKPKMHLWETGIIRVSRHPQMVGQTLWCIAHMIWLGNSMVLSASIGLIVHHVFGVWNGDRRMAKRYGVVFENVRKRTSIIPFGAIIQGRQELPRDYYKEFLRIPYLTILLLTLIVYLAHPLMQQSGYTFPQ